MSSIRRLARLLLTPSKTDARSESFDRSHARKTIVSGWRTLPEGEARRRARNERKGTRVRVNARRARNTRYPRFLAVDVNGRSDAAVPLRAFPLACACTESPRSPLRAASSLDIIAAAAAWESVVDADYPPCSWQGGCRRFLGGARYITRARRTIRARQPGNSTGWNHPLKTRIPVPTLRTRPGRDRGDRARRAALTDGAGQRRDRLRRSRKAGRTLELSHVRWRTTRACALPRRFRIAAATGTTGR